MSESASPGFAEEPSVAGPQADLNGAALESALADFRRWFQAAVAANGEALPVQEAPAGVDLATLLGHYVALRQEVNLQTRAVRAQQEQTAETVRYLGQSVEALSRPRPSVDSDDKQRPLLMTLIELYDALSLAGRETARTEVSLLPALEQLAEDLDESEEEPEEQAREPARSFWARWILSPSADAALRESQDEVRRRREERQERQERASENAERVRSALSALVTGYTMSLERLERALRKHGLQPMQTVGETFDPERMEVLEAVTNSGRPSGEVVEEVRRGYLWNGRLFRCAQVRVART